MMGLKILVYIDALKGWPIQKSGVFWMGWPNLNFMGWSQVA